ALLQFYKPNDTSGLARVCLSYAHRLFQAGVAGVSLEQIEGKLRVVHENEQFLGVWRWIVTLGFELGPDRWLHANRGLETTPILAKVKPVWDMSRRVLTYENKRLRKYAAPAEAQILILDTFQELDWCDTVDSPFPKNAKGERSRKNALKNL